jgi:hypothetical protein
MRQDKQIWSAFLIQSNWSAVWAQTGPLRSALGWAV